MKSATLRKRLLAGDMLAGTFIKTPSYELIEILAVSGLDFVCLDAEHSPFDRAAMDACLAIARALDFPVLVRVASGSAENILQALDCGAVGVVVPHVINAARAAEVARFARFGLNGRGYAGFTRWAGFGSRAMSDVLQQSKDETLVLAQIEEPEGVDDASAIAATDGIDGLFIGPADLSIGYGRTDTNSAELAAAFKTVSAAAKANGKAMVTFVPNVEKAAEWSKYGINVFFVGSEHVWVAQASANVAGAIHELG